MSNKTLSEQIVEAVKAKADQIDDMYYGTVKAIIIKGKLSLLKREEQDKIEN